MKTLTENPKLHAAQRPDAGNMQKKAANAVVFADRRPEAAIYKQAKQMADNSPQTMRIAQLQHIANADRPNRTGLPDNLKTGIENLSGYTMDDVRVHYNSDKPAQLHAHAYAQGTDIHIAPGQEKHLPHEAWHVVQQKQGRVKATMQMKEAQINDDEGLEREADVKGEQARSRVTQSKKLPMLKSESNIGPTILQKKERGAVVVWDITHEVVPDNEGSLFGDDADPFKNEGIELHRDDRITVDDEDIFQSRRGANQEQSHRREHDKKAPLTNKWLKLLHADKGGASGKGYVREETVKIDKEEEERHEIVAENVEAEEAKKAGNTIHGAWGELRKKRRMSTEAWKNWESTRKKKGKDSSPSWDQIEEGYDVSGQLREDDNYDKEGTANQAIITAYGGKDGTTPIGIIVIELRAGNKYPDDEGNVNKRWYLRWLIGHPALKGAGGKLLDLALDHVREHNGEAVWVQSAPSAQQWYQSKGFKPLEIKQQEAYDPDFEEGWDSMLMVRFL